MEIKVIVENQAEFVRVDKYIVSLQHKSLYSRTLIDKLIENKSVKVNNMLCEKKSFLVKEGDAINITVPDFDICNEIPEKENIPLSIIYEDDFLAVIDKPYGLTVHPAPGNYTGTLVNALLFHFEDSLEITDNNTRPGIVHRLDKDTSGLIVIAKDNKTHHDLSKLFMERKINKTYLCFSLGVPKQLTGVIDLPIARHKTDRKKMCISETGRSAVSSYETLIDFEYFSFLKIKIMTGRTHQIRVHLESIHHPVIGDDLYNSNRRIIGSVPVQEQLKLKFFLSKYVQRQLLHAYELSFIHPVSGEQMIFISEIPDDFKNIIKFFKNHFNYYIVNEEEVEKIKGVL